PAPLDRAWACAGPYSSACSASCCHRCGSSARSGRKSVASSRKACALLGRITGPLSWNGARSGSTDYLQVEPKDRACAGGRVDRQPSAVRPDDALRQIQAQPGSPHLALGLVPAATKLLEDAGHIGRVDALALVGHLDAHA